MKTTESKHTPGPWKISETISGKCPNVEPVGLNSEGNMKFNAMVESPAYFLAGVSGVGRDECLANARLIAAAPELLEALEELVELEVCRNMLKARAAIAKAKGAK